ncbi:carbamoyltransferase N-terminal domain-containing protein [Dactylosporangium salmoneum]|uniref:Carbamoyltransferase n=1 Tax=Dactylosporangium salmoneum TaxID=53361 RepID=A0ABN3GSM4_9ACTN
MLICGIKASHDGGVAVIDDGRLLFSVEVEKLDNGPRYSFLENLQRVTEILAREGLSPDVIDQFVIDGWHTTAADGGNAVPIRDGDRSMELRVAPYLEGPGDNGPLQRYAFDSYDFNGTGGYASYTHVANHLLGAYCTSPFAAREEDALALVWDGGVVPRLYRVHAARREVTMVSALLPVIGNSFADFSAQFDPFRYDADALSPEEADRRHLSIAGKAMAYAALGTAEPDVFAVFDDIIGGFRTLSTDNARVLGAKIASNRDELASGLSNADLIATFQAYLGRRLLDRLAAVVERQFPGERLNLVLGGGCALNIKWNTMIRASGLFHDVFVPPFPNDAGAAIGTAACEMFRRGRIALDWDVYRGPAIATGSLPSGWRAQACDERQVAALLQTEGEPVVVLSGRAELGPRALGNRSILAPATDPGMKGRLNDIKHRAQYRPVAPICLADRAPEVFEPGTADPYMLFEHRMRPGWAQRVPAVVHLDGTARLQTIEATQDVAAARILSAYAELTGIPVLCNTSANFDGCGFFPDVASAARWGGARYIWSDGTLYTSG